MDCKERGSRARGVYHTQDTSRVGTAKVKQAKEADTRIIAKEEEVGTRLLLYTRLKAVFSRCEDVAKYQNTRDHLA